MPLAMHRLRTTIRGLAVALFLLAFSRAEGQAIIKVNDNINFKLGFLLQPQADFQEVVNTKNGPGGFAENLFVRRVRLIVGGQVAKNVFFFFETDNPNLGKAPKALGAGFQTLDAAAEWRIAKEFNIQAGLIRSPISREGLKSTPTQFMLDFSAYNLPTGTALQNNAERDTGMMFRGYFFCDRLEYRSAILSGFRAANAKNSPRFTERLQYNFFDTEVYNLPSYPGAYLGSKKVLAVGVGYDTQNDFRYGSADMYVDIPIPVGSFESTIQYQYINGGTTLGAALPEQNLFQIEGGVFLKSLKVATIARYEQKAFTANVNTPKNENRVALGLNYYPRPKTPHALNFKVWWERVALKCSTATPTNPCPASGFATDRFTAQMQIYYF
jgi:hypothetical protein